MKIITIIPARGGSKEIPKKNILDILGKPLLAWSVEQSLQTTKVESTYVSSDCDEILSVASNFGAKTISRPAEHASDTASSESAVIHAINSIEEDFDAVLFMQATSPLRLRDDLKNAIIQFEQNSYDSMFSGGILEDFLIWEKNDENFSSFNYDYKKRGIRQNRVPQYVENGSFYISKKHIYLNEKNRLGGRIGCYEMQAWQHHEIDSYEDIEINEYFLKKKIQ